MVTSSVLVSKKCPGREWTSVMGQNDFFSSNAPRLFWFSTPWFSGQHRVENQTRNQAAEMKRTKEYFSKTGNFLPPSEGPSLHTLSFYCILDPLSALPQFICKIHLFLQHFLPLFSLNLCCCILHTWFGTTQGTTQAFHKFSRFLHFLQIYRIFLKTLQHD